MPSYVSPGVYTFEKDLSQFAPSINSSVVGLVGFASRGPVNKATLITSAQQLVDTLGAPDENIQGQALEGAVEILETTNALYFVRSAVAASSVEASATLPIGGCPVIAVSGSQGHFGEDATHAGLGVSAAPMYFVVNGRDDAGNALFTSNKTYTVVSSLTDGVAESIKLTEGELLAFKKVFGGELDSGKVGAYFEPLYKRSPYLVAPFAGSSAYLEVTAYGDAALTTPVSALKPVPSLSGSVSAAGPWCSSVKCYGSTFSGVEHEGRTADYLIESLYPGQGYNLGTKSDGTTSGNSAEISQFGNQNWKLTVNQDGVAAETFKMSFVNSGAFVTDILNTADLGSNNKSDLVVGNFVSGSSSNKITVSKLNDFTNTITSIGFTGGVEGTWGGAAFNQAGGAIPLHVVTSPVAESQNSENARFIKPVQGTVGLANGTNGVGTTTENATAIIGDATIDPKTGMQALDDDTISISLAAVPGITT